MKEEQVKQLITQIASLSAVGSCLGCDLLNWASCNGDSDWAKFWEFGCDVPEDFLANYGWNANVIQPGENGTGHSRYNYTLPPREELEQENVFWVTAVKEI